MPNMTSEYPPIILYSYPFSPFAKRVAWYLQLRGIPHKICVSISPSITVTVCQSLTL